MSKEVISANLQTIMAKIGKSIEKAVGEDIRTYLATNDNATNNALPFLRGDYINTNIKKAMESEAVEIKYFNRSSWKESILIVRDDQVTLSVCAKKTLERIPKNRNRKSPHYLQSLLHTENGDEISSSHQITLTDFDPSFGCVFSDEDFEKDFLAIMEETLSLHEGFRHWVITYEAEKSSVVNLTAVLLDKNFGIVREVPLMDLLKPNFGNLTTVPSVDKGLHASNLDIIRICGVILSRRTSSTPLSSALQMQIISKFEVSESKRDKFRVLLGT